MFNGTYSMLVGASVELIVVLDLKVLCPLLVSQQQSVDCSVCTEASVIRYHLGLIMLTKYIEFQVAST